MTPQVQSRDLRDRAADPRGLLQVTIAAGATSQSSLFVVTNSLRLQRFLVSRGRTSDPGDPGDRV